jgi:hypothetical protein
MSFNAGGVTLFLLLLTVSAFAQSDPLQRAIAAVGGDPALQRARSISVVMVGTQDSRAIGQGYFPLKPLPRRQQETLIVDEPTRRASFRREGTNSDGSPNFWRFTTFGDSGVRMNLKTRNVIWMDKAQATLAFEDSRWRIPQLALAEMKRRRAALRCGERRIIQRQVYDGCEFMDERNSRFTVLFSRQSGQLMGYEYPSSTMRGTKVVRYQFKPYVVSGIGLFPSGYSFTIGEEVYKDLDLIDVRPAVMDEHPWFIAPPRDSKPVSTVGQQPPAGTEEVAPGVWFIRNVGGYNAMFARVGDCIAVFDAPASRGMFGGPIPSAGDPPDLSAIIINKVRETTGQKVCYVIPTHHHDDHFSGIAGFARAGATIITTPNNETLARAVVRGGGLSTEPKFQLVREKLTLGEGESRIDVHVISQELHAETMIFIHLPGRNLAFEGDLSDYVPSARNFLHYVSQKGLKIERVYSVHSSRWHRLEDIQGEDPEN